MALVIEIDENSYVLGSACSYIYVYAKCLFNLSIPNRLLDTYSRFMLNFKQHFLSRFMESTCRFSISPKPIVKENTELCNSSIRFSLQKQKEIFLCTVVWVWITLSTSLFASG